MLKWKIWIIFHNTDAQHHKLFVIQKRIQQELWCHQHRALHTCIFRKCSTLSSLSICMVDIMPEITLQWRHNDHDGVSNHQPHACLLNRLFRRRSKKTSMLRVTGLCVGNSPGPVNSPQRPVTRKMFPFDDVIMYFLMTLDSKSSKKKKPQKNQLQITK